MRQRYDGAAFAALTALLLGACGDAPTTPTGPAVTITPPANTVAVIDSITVQGTRSREPANFADLGESVAVSAKVHDAETSADLLQYAWTASAGTIAGTGSGVTWQAPATATTLPADVSITLRVVERYGAALAFQHEVTGTATVSLHDSTNEVGDMSRQFLLDFSNSSLRDLDYIMRNFSTANCPDPAEVVSERSDVSNNRAERWITDYRIGLATVILDFGARCPFPDPARRETGDACAIVPSYWADIELAGGKPSVVDGTDYVAAVYAPPSRRWWLCASEYSGRLISGSAWRGFIR